MWHHPVILDSLQNGLDHTLTFQVQIKGGRLSLQAYGVSKLLELLHPRWEKKSLWVEIRKILRWPLGNVLLKERIARERSELGDVDQEKDVDTAQDLRIQSEGAGDRG